MESLGEDDFLFGRTFIRDFDVQIDLSKTSLLIRVPQRQRNLKRKEVVGRYAQRMKLILDGGTILKPKEVTLCRLKLSGAESQYRNDRQLCVLSIKDVRSEASCVSAGRTITLTKDGRVAVPMLNPTDKEIYMRPEQKVPYALPAFTELTDTRESVEDCSNKACKIFSDGLESIQVKLISSSDGQESMSSTSSGRSNFPAKAEVDKNDMLPDLKALSDRVTPEQLERPRAVLEANAAVFAKNKANMGRCNLVEHWVDLEEGAVPHREGARRMAPFKAEKANEKIRHLLSLDLIEPSYSPWACGNVMAKKKGNQLRFCCDFCFLNAKTIPNAYPLPRIDESLARLGCAIYFTT